MDSILCSAAQSGKSRSGTQMLRKVYLRSLNGFEMTALGLQRATVPIGDGAKARREEIDERTHFG